MSKLCLNCETNEAVKYSTYSNGNFCEKKCARAYSTKNDRANISKKVSQTLTGSGNGDVTKNCPTCKKDFTNIYKRRHRQFCSPNCSNNNDAVKTKLSQTKKALANGIINTMTMKEKIAKQEAMRVEQTNLYDSK